MVRCAVYVIRNRKNNKVYVGSSKDISKRWLQHKISLINCTHHNDELLKDYQQYGREVFEFEVLEECDEFELRYKELQAINAYNFDELYNQKNIKDEIVYRVCKYLEGLGVEFYVDVKVPIAGKKYNFNIFALVNDKKVYISLRDDSYFSDQEAKQKAANSFALKAEYVAEKNGYLQEFYYNSSLTEEDVEKIVQDIIDYISL